MSNTSRVAENWPWVEGKALGLKPFCADRYTFDYWKRTLPEYLYWRKGALTKGAKLFWNERTLAHWLAVGDGDAPTRLKEEYLA